MRSFMETRPEAFDFVEVVPDVAWNDLGPGCEPRYVHDPAATSFLQAMAGHKAIVPHSIGLSIGSAHRFDRQHLAQMARWHAWFGFPWHSDHLSFHLAEHAGGKDLNVNLTLPLPLDWETLEMLVDRVREVRRQVPVPFLLENNVTYFRFGDEDLDEASFLNELCRRSGCGLLLDLHNLYVNCRNLGTDPYAFLEALDLDAVVEIHVAGGLEFQGFYLDAHSGSSPAPVWDLLDQVLPCCANLGGVVFELFGSWFEPLGEDGLRRQLDRMSEAWARYQPVTGRRR